MSRKKPAVKTSDPAAIGQPTNAGEKDPHVHKIENNDIFSSSENLLVWTDKACTTGRFIKYHGDHPHATPPRMKGDSYYYDAVSGEVIEGVTWFMPIKEIPLPGKKDDK